MASRFTELVIDCHQPHELAAFWCAVLDYEVIDERDDLNSARRQTWKDQQTG